MVREATGRSKVGFKEEDFDEESAPGSGPTTDLSVEGITLAIEAAGGNDEAEEVGVGDEVGEVTVSI